MGKRSNTLFYIVIMFLAGLTAGSLTLAEAPPQSPSEVASR